MFKTMWNKIKDWSGWSHAGSIFMMRMEAFLSLLAAAFAGLDYNALMALDFSKGFNTPVLAGSGILFFKAVVMEKVRRSGSSDFETPKKKKR